MQNIIIIILIIVAVAAMILGGWVSFANLDDRATMTIHKTEVKQDTESVLKSGEDLAEEAVAQSRKLIDQADDSEPVKSEPPNQQ